MMKQQSKLKMAVKLLFLLLALYAGTISAQTSANYAAQLMRERDYYRAISAYKELAFFSSNADSLEVFGLQIAKAYRLSDKYELGAQTLNTLQKKQKLSQGGMKSWYIEMGMDQLLLDNKSWSYDNLIKERAADSSGIINMYLSLWHLKYTSLALARDYAERAAQGSKPGRELDVANEYFSYLSKSEGPSSRSPLLASALSILLPGAGQSYCGHYIDGLQAFTFTGIFVYSALLARQYDRDISGNSVRSTLMISVAGIFYLANILGAERTAEYYNIKQSEDIYQGGLRKVQALDY